MDKQIELGHEITRLQFENKRLAEALERISTMENMADGSVGLVDNPYQKAIRVISKICKEALQSRGNV